MLDVPTLIVVMSILQLLMASVLFFTWRANQQVPATKIWFYSFVLLLSGSSLLLLRQALPPWISIVLANTLLITGYIFNIFGIRQYTGRLPISWLWAVSFLVLLSSTFWFLTYIEPSFSKRIVVYGLITFGISIFTAFEALRSSKNRNAATIFFGILSVVHGLFLLARGIYTGIVSSEHTLQSGSSFITQLVFIEGIVMTVLLGVSLILMTSQYHSEKLRRLTERDPLTDVFNRRAFFQLTEKNISYSRRKKTPLVMLSMDLDHFKRINDTYGHHVGDEVLQGFTHAVQSVLRAEDILGRIGGEEFSILLPETDLDNAVEVGNRICHACENSHVPTDNGFVFFTVSIGAALLSDSMQLQELYDAADLALYSAKKSGRNRVET